MFCIGQVFSKHSYMVPIWMTLIPPVIESQTYYYSSAVLYLLTPYNTHQTSHVLWSIPSCLYAHIWYIFMRWYRVLLLHCPHFILLWSSAVPTAGVLYTSRVSPSVCMCSICAVVLALLAICTSSCIHYSGGYPNQLLGCCTHNNFYWRRW